MAKEGNYTSATRHPWPCLLFVCPLTLVYEAGVKLLGGEHPETLRNGVDAWLRSGVKPLQGSLFWLPSLLFILMLLVWTWIKRADRPGKLLDVLSGMILESVAYALALWALSRALGPLLARTLGEMSMGGLATPASGDPSELAQLVTYLGAGIYEEALFRLLLFSGLFALLRRLDIWSPLAGVLAALASATLFSAAHHIGPNGQPYSDGLFFFRLTAGLYFTLLYHLRGFGIAVGTHACYNVMIS